MSRTIAAIATATMAVLVSACGASEDAPADGPIRSNETALTTSSRAYLHASGRLDATPPTRSSAIRAESGKLSFANGNPWVEIGAWTGAPLALIGVVQRIDVDLWVGLKSGGDTDVRFDFRADLDWNGTPIATGQGLCLADLAKKPATALHLEPWVQAPPMILDDTTDELTLHVSVRIGTDGNDAPCAGPTTSHGVRAYYDAADRPASLGITMWTGCSGNATDPDCPKIQCSTQARLIADPYPPKWIYVEPNVKVFRLDPTTLGLYAAGVARADHTTDPHMFRSATLPEPSDDYVSWIWNVAPDLHKAPIYGSIVKGFFVLQPFSFVTRDPWPGGTMEYATTCSGMTSVRTGTPPPPGTVPY